METSEDYKIGFIEQCIESGVNKQDTEDLFKMAAYASAFDNEEFKKGFLSCTVPMDLDRMPYAAKAEIARRAAVKEYGMH